ncbi:MAG TPA: hypothetical protein VLN48_01845 [Bryobacteraceae bacterium]|nr:hypothetical protein [Bryobacteraceae bacterium]
MTSAESLRSRWMLGSAAAFAMAWAITRAAVQSITIDEADTYNVFVFRRLYLWYAANNHILNSTLMYGFTEWLGLSQFTARLPALLGAALYIAAAYRLCRLLGASLLVQLTVFVGLVFNPFLFDHLVAARGYGLALAFLLWAIVYFAEQVVQGAEGWLLTACVVSSACAGLSVDANLAFAFVNLATMTAILVVALYMRPKQWFRVLAACVLPGAAVVAIVSSYALLHWHSDELYYGAHSFRETFAGLIASSLFQTRFEFLQPLVYPLVGATGLLWLAYLLFRRTPARLAPLGFAAAAVFAATAAIHYAAFRLFGLPLPKERTAIFFFPLFMIAAGVLAATPPASRGAQVLRAGFVGALALMAVNFLLCFRLTYFKEWRWDADVQKTYSILTCLNRTHQVRHVTSTWPYRAALDFYQLADPTSLQEITDEFDPRQTEVYVIDSLHTPEALQGDWKVFYRSPVTDLVLAADPERARTIAAGPCVSPK